MASDFVHLHLHSDFSLLDGACTVKGLVALCEEYDMPGLAITDHGFMGASIDFYNGMKAKGRNPILGMEAYVSPTTRYDKNKMTPRVRGNHLVLLAKSYKGFMNIAKLNSLGFTQGMYYRPRIDKETLATFSEDVIGSSACIGGEIAQYILDGDDRGAMLALGEYQDIFGKDNFYLELMDHGMEEEDKVNKALIRMARRYDVPLVATNDAHYLRREHAKSHDALLCIQTRSTLNDPNRFKFFNDSFYVKTPEEMKELFKEVPDAISNTVKICEQVDIEIKYMPDVNHYPIYEIQHTKFNDQKDYLYDICLDGVELRYKFNPRRDPATYNEFEKTVMDRMVFELSIIDRMGFNSYFLVVWDFIDYARQQSISVGPGRGSGAGSLVAFIMGITDIEPLEYGLLFERFLNPERVSPPDFDIDFCERRRGEVIEYVRNKYGRESVVRIGTYGTLKAKGVVKDIARVLGHPPSVGNEISKLIPEGPKVTLDSAIAESKELKTMVENDPAWKEIFEYARPLEGLNRNMSMHACGVIIGDQRVDNIAPLCFDSNKELITQFPAGPDEMIGLLKMDFLGLKTLTVIQDAVDNIKQSHGIDLDMSEIPLDDQASFDLLSEGDTVSVFQLESPGMQKLCCSFGVENLKHVIALLAIYRPGPMQFIPTFIARKKGTEVVEYDHPLMEDLLKETYGIMLYQEQIMQVVQVLAGFTLGGADMLRRGIGKKKQAIIDQLKIEFRAGCAKTHNISGELADQIWSKIEMFAGYGFNKSHSAAYGVVSYRTAYLKANYRIEFMAAVLSSEIKTAEKVSWLIGECKKSNVDILGPDVSISNRLFTVDNGSIRFGIGAIRGVGETQATAIIKAREEGGAFESLLDFCERVGGALNSRVMDSLARAGAFDSFGLKRSQILAIIEDTIRAAQNTIKDKASGQGSLFDMLGGEEQDEALSIPVPQIDELSEDEMLEGEKELLGFYVTGHPLDKYEYIIRNYSLYNTLEIPSMGTDEGIVMAGAIKTASVRISQKSGKPYGIVQFEDLDGVIDCMVFGKTLEECNHLLKDDTPVFIEAVTSKRDDDDPVTVMIRRIIPIHEVLEERSEELLLHLYEGINTKSDLEKIKAICLKHKGRQKLIFSILCQNEDVCFVETSHEYEIKICRELIDEIIEVVGRKRFKIKANLTPPAVKKRWIPKPKEDVEQAS